MRRRKAGGSRNRRRMGRRDSTVDKVGVVAVAVGFRETVEVPTTRTKNMVSMKYCKMRLGTRRKNGEEEEVSVRTG